MCVLLLKLMLIWMKQLEKEKRILTKALKRAELEVSICEDAEEDDPDSSNLSSKQSTFSQVWCPRIEVMPPVYARWFESHVVVYSAVGTRARTHASSRPRLHGSHALAASTTPNCWCVRNRSRSFGTASFCGRTIWVCTATTQSNEWLICPDVTRCTAPWCHRQAEGRGARSSSKSTTSLRQTTEDGGNIS
jgi:hypothetical protein